MRLFLFTCLSFFVYSCSQPDHKPVNGQTTPAASLVPDRSYDETLKEIASSRHALAAKYAAINSFDKKNTKALTDAWVNGIGTKLYSQWQNTPWDFNGTTLRPNEGSIACGYFVTSMLRDMDLKLNRNKLSICASSVMMRSLAPHQKLMNLSYLSYAAFNDSLIHLGRGVYIIGLDSHTGFIVNDGSENYFIHSNYIKRKGVTKEPVLNSAALRSSKTRWMISLTGDKEFLNKWLKGKG